MAAGLTPAQAAGSPGWRIVATVATPGEVTELTSIAIADQRHAWAVGISVTAKTGAFAPVVEGWGGSAWAPVSLPPDVVANLGTEPLLDAVAASSPTNMWAFTTAGGWLHWNGVWTAGRITKSPIEIDSTLVFGQSNVWAFGETRPVRGAPVPYAARFDGPGGWKRSSVPGTNGISAASAVNSTDIWATLGQPEFAFGGGSRGGGLVHWFRGRWHRVTSFPSQLRNASLGSVLARSDKDVWVGGAMKNGKHGTTEAIGRWNGRKWTVTTLRARATANGYRVASLVSDGAGGIWALGNCLASSNCSPGTPWRLWHETAGNWSRPIQPRLSSHNTVLDSLAPVAHSVWAAGAIQEGSSANGIVALWGRAPS
jgi:hypothetical protein